MPGHRFQELKRKVLDLVRENKHPNKIIWNNHTIGWVQDHVLEEMMKGQDRGKILKAKKTVATGTRLQIAREEFNETQTVTVRILMPLLDFYLDGIHHIENAPDNPHPETTRQIKLMIPKLTTSLAKIPENTRVPIPKSVLDELDFIYVKEMKTLLGDKYAKWQEHMGIALEHMHKHIFGDRQP